jgi:hypothetical protein
MSEHAPLICVKSRTSSVAASAFVEAPLAGKGLCEGGDDERSRSRRWIGGEEVRAVPRARTAEVRWLIEARLRRRVGEPSSSCRRARWVDRVLERARSGELRRPSGCAEICALLEPENRHESKYARCVSRPPDCAAPEAYHEREFYERCALSLPVLTAWTPSACTTTLVARDRRELGGR